MMKNIFFVALLNFAALNCVGQNATPVDGYDNFMNRLFTEVPIPNDVYKSKETVLNISVDSLSNAKLLLIKPYNKELYISLKKFVSESKWNPTFSNGKAINSKVTVPLIFETEDEYLNSEASPKITMMEFYQYFGKRLNLKSYEQKTLICDTKFNVKEDGNLELISISENSAEIFNELKRLFAEAEKWNPALKNGKPVSSVKNFKLKIVK